MDYLGTYRPSLEVADCLLSHVEPLRDLGDAAGLWYFGPLPDTPDLLAPSFAATDRRVLFSGHRHRWFLADERGAVDWDGGRPVELSRPGRWLAVIGAVCEGRCAVYDTDAAVLTPVSWEPTRGDDP